jgi:hypothetical protein
MSFSDDLYSMDLGLNRSLRRRAWRRRAVWLLALVAFIETMGIPHVRVPASSRAGHRPPLRYWSVTGIVASVPPQLSYNRPLFLLLPMEKSTAAYAAEGLRVARGAGRSVAVRFGL